MSAGVDDDLELEIGHVLFIDIVAYSKLVIDEQRAAQRKLNEIVRSTEQFKISEADDKLVRLPTGDGMALVFRDTIEAPARCAAQIARALRADQQIRLRMGIHSGPVSDVADVNERANVAGDGVNMAQRVMDCGDAGHILLSKRVADDLSQYGRWRAQLHHLGEIEMKHGVKIDIFNLTGEGIGNSALPEKIVRKRAELESAAKRVRVRRRVFVAAAVGIAALMIALSIFAYRMRNELASMTTIPEQSVAVLPFENLSGDASNGFLSSGIQDEIITRLSKIAALKVISRTSTAQYGSKPRNLPQIAKELGVAAMLEGSVQKSGNQIRVNVQLIKATTDVHLWAETYDRELIDILKVESDIAQEIASALRATLSPEEKARVENKPTNNAESYALYLKAIEAMNRAVGSAVPLEEAQHFLEQAIALDPRFAVAHARLSRVHTWLHAIYQPTEIHKRSARSEAEEALRLQRDLSEAHVAMGNYFGRIERAYENALKEYDIATKTSPNDSVVLLSRGNIQMRRGHFREAITDLERASSLDPRSSNIFDTLGNAYSYVQMFSAAERAKKRAAEVIPGPSPAKFNEEMSWAWCYLALTGSFEKIDEVLARSSTDPKDDPTGVMAQLRFQTRMAQRNYADAERTMAASPVTIFEVWNGPRVTKSFFFGIVAMVQGDMARAKPLFEAELQFAQSELSESPDAANRHGQLGLVYAYLGRKEEAIAEGRLAVERLPITKDAFDGPWLLYNLAEIYGRVGEHDRAVALLEQLLATPGGVILADLKRDWIWDPLRNNARFQKILAAPPPKVTYK